MTRHLLALFCLSLFIVPNVATYLKNWKRGPMSGCAFGGDCSMMVSALRDPRTLVWQPERYTKAKNYFKIYQDLLNNDEENVAPSTFKRRAILEKRRTNRLKNRRQTAVQSQQQPQEYLLFDV